MKVEILAIGTELTLGVTVDTNSAYLARHLTEAGIPPSRVSIVDDNVERIAALMQEALGRSDLVLCTGGLGPTVDDMTREAAARALGRPLEFRQELLDQIAARFAAFNRVMSENNRTQAYVPQGARVLENPRGTAPAFIVEDERGTLIVLPGVPHEMRYLFENAVMPYLRDERGVRGITVVRTLHVALVGESVIGEQIADLMRLEHPVVGISAKMGRCELRISARAEDRATAESIIAPVEAELRQRLGSALMDNETISQQVVRLLRERNLTLALYEGNSVAPVYQAFFALPDGLRQVRGIMIHPLDQPADEQAILSLAQAGAARMQNHWTSDLSLGVQAMDHPQSDGFTPVCAVLRTPDGEQHAAGRYDLRQTESWDYVSNLALDMVRRYLSTEPEQASTETLT